MGQCFPDDSLASFFPAITIAVLVSWLSRGEGNLLSLLDIIEMFLSSASWPLLRTLADCPKKHLTALSDKFPYLTLHYLLLHSFWITWACGWTRKFSKFLFCFIWSLYVQPSGGIHHIDQLIFVSYLDLTYHQCHNAFLFLICSHTFTRHLTCFLILPTPVSIKICFKISHENTQWLYLYSGQIGQLPWQSFYISRVYPYINTILYPTRGSCTHLINLLWYILHSNYMGRVGNLA